MRLRLLTWNVHKCIGGVDRRYEPERVRAVIAHHEPDLVCLQEVDRAVPRSRLDRQVDLLGDLLGFRHRTWYPNVLVRSGGEYGNAILSRFPLTESVNIDLTVPPKKRRSVLHARYRVRLRGGGGRAGAGGGRAGTGGGRGSGGGGGGRGGPAGGSSPRARPSTRTLHVYNMHLGLSGAERKAQLRKFLASHPFVGLDHRTPVVVAGDFNDVWGTLGKKLLAPAGFRSISPIRTFPAYAPLRALDAIYVRGRLEIHHAQTSRTELSRRASDHLPLIADLLIT